MKHVRRALEAAMAPDVMLRRDEGMLNCKERAGSIGSEGRVVVILYKNGSRPGG